MELAIDLELELAIDLELELATGEAEKPAERFVAVLPDLVCLVHSTELCEHLVGQALLLLQPACRTREAD